MTPPVPTGLQRRAFAGKVQIRAAAEGSKSPGTIVGYAALFNSLSCDLGGYMERIAPGAFSGCMADDVRCVFNHDASLILGRSTAGTLRFEEDQVGLKFECDLPNTSVGRDVAESITREDISGNSFMFTCQPDGMTWDWAGPMPICTVGKVSRLYDVGPVTYPAYEATTVDMRSFEAARSNHEAVASARIQAAIAQIQTRQRQLEIEVLPSL